CRRLRRSMVTDSRSGSARLRVRAGGSRWACSSGDLLAGGGGRRGGGVAGEGQEDVVEGGSPPRQRGGLDARAVEVVEHGAQRAHPAVAWHGQRGTVALVDDAGAGQAGGRGVQIGSVGEFQADVVAG